MFLFFQILFKIKILINETFLKMKLENGIYENWMEVSYPASNRYTTHLRNP